jgi:hypothetical protein
MSRKPLKFKLTDLRRVFCAVKEEELCARVTVDPKSGSITVIPCPPSDSVGVNVSESVQANPWDGVLSNAPDEKGAP